MNEVLERLLAVFGGAEAFADAVRREYEAGDASVRERILASLRRLEELR